MLREAKEDLPDSIYIRLRTDGSLFNLRRLLARTKTIEELITELLFFSPTRRKPYSTSSTASQMQLRTSASPSARRRLRCCTNPLHVWHTVLLTSASMAPTLTQWNTSLTWVTSSPMMPQSARILTTACPKPAVPLEDCQREYGRATRSASPQRSRYIGPSSFPPSCTVQRPGFSIGSRSGYWGGFTGAACAQSLASNGKTT